MQGDARTVERAGQPVLHRPPFASRRTAGQELAQVLQRMSWPRPVVLALPRGGVPVAAEVARALGAPLDLLMVRKIGAPGQPELAVAAMAWLDAPRPEPSAASPDGRSPSAQTFVDTALLAATGGDQVHVNRGVAREGLELERRRQRYLRGRSPTALDGRTVILVDDGIATGTTLRAALKALRAATAPNPQGLLATPGPASEGMPPAGRGPRAVVLAVPVAPAQVLQELAGEVDVVVCLWTPAPFVAVGAHYRDFRQVSDDEVVAALAGKP